MSDGIGAGSPDEGTVSGRIDAGKRIDILQKTYAEASNYDRHYSITRSSLTVLLVTVALAALNTVLPPVLDAISTTEHRQLGPKLAYLTVPAMLLGFALVINIHFYRLTYACRLVERWIEEMIVLNAVGMEQAVRVVAAASTNMSGLKFRDDLREVRKGVSLLYLDTMAKLLVAGELLLFGAVAVAILFAAESTDAALLVLGIVFVLFCLVLTPKVLARAAPRVQVVIHDWPSPDREPAVAIAAIQAVPTDQAHTAMLVVGLVVTLAGAAAASAGAFVPVDIQERFQSIMPGGTAQQLFTQSSLTVPGFAIIGVGTILQIVAVSRGRRLRR